MHEKLIRLVKSRWGVFEMELLKLSYSPFGSCYEATFISPNGWTVSHYFEYKRPLIRNVIDPRDYASYDDAVVVYQREGEDISNSHIRFVLNECKQ